LSPVRKIDDETRSPQLRLKNAPSTGFNSKEETNEKRHMRFWSEKKCATISRTSTTTRTDLLASTTQRCNPPPQGGLCPRRQRLMFRHTPVSSGACAETHASNGSRSDTHGSRPPRAAGNPRLSRAMDAAAEKRAPQRNIENMYEESNPREAESYKVNFRALTPALLRREEADHA